VAAAVAVVVRNKAIVPLRANLVADSRRAVAAPSRLPVRQPVDRLHSIAQADADANKKTSSAYALEVFLRLNV